MIYRIQKKASSLDPGFIVVISICLLAIWPFISRSSLPQATDAELHIFRLAELSRLFRAGEFFPRWAPNFYFGYGYPIFNYYAPLVYYLGLIFDLMPVLGPVEAVKVLFVLSYLIGGLGLYGFMRESWNRTAGIVAAAAYVYSPYILYIDPHARGDLAESVSFALLPPTFWAFERLRRDPSATVWLVSSSLMAAVIFSHNLMAMVIFAMLLGWVIWQEIVGGVHQSLHGEHRTISFLWRYRLFFSLIAGIGLSAVFWLVVALEQNAVNLNSLIGDGGHFDFRNHFLSLRELFSASKLIDWGAAGPSYVFNIGVSQWLLALIGILSIIAGISKGRKQAIFFVVAAFVLVALMLPISIFVWDGIPLMPFLQFPWRLLGAIAVVIAVLAGIGVDSLITILPRKMSLWLPGIANLFILIFALPMLQVQPWPDSFGSTTASRVLSEELRGRWLGTTSTADFVPATVAVLPRPQDSVTEAILEGRPVDRVNRATLPPGTSVKTEEVTPLHMQFSIDSEQDFLLRLFIFDFPGWSASIDGEIVEIELGLPEGFIVVPVPAGDHFVEIEFGSTWARTVGVIVSVLSLAFVLLTARYFAVYQRILQAISEEPSVRETANRSALWPVFLIPLILLGLNALVIEPNGLLRYESTNFSAQPADKELFVNFGHQVALIGYDLPGKQVDPGQRFELTAYWKLIGEPVTNYQVFVHLFDESGRLVSQSDKLNPGDYPVRRWPSDKYVRDRHILELPDDLQSGTYTISLGLWVASEGWRLPVVNTQGANIADTYQLGERILVK